MNKREVADCEMTIEPEIVTEKGLMRLTSSGRHTAIAIGTAAGARIQIGRRVFWNVKKVREYLYTYSE